MRQAVGFALTGLMAIVQTACSSQPYSDMAIKPIFIQQHLQQSWQSSHRDFIGFPTPAAFSVCHDLSCHRVSKVSLSVAEWQQVRVLFKPQADSAEAERHQIQHAVARLEQLVGMKTGTSGDHAKNRLTGSRQGQLDCIDEATNTSVYLRMLESEQLLSWHRSAPRTSRGPLSGQAPHNTASIIDTQSLERYAVDAWYFDNGEPPAIVLMTDWKRGWRPQPQH
jgi:hypothetical protein